MRALVMSALMNAKSVRKQFLAVLRQVLAEPPER